MPNEPTEQERNREFTKYLQARLFGLMAFIDRPREHERFPMASGVVIETAGYYALLTVAHYLQDVQRWKHEGRLKGLVLLVHHESGICNPIQLDLEENFASFCNVLDVGFIVLNDNIVAEISKRGGLATRRDTLSMSPETMHRFFLVGHAAAYSKLVRETIATGYEGTNSVAWQLLRPGDVAIAISRLLYDGKGTDPGTYRFALMNGFADYSGSSGGPIYGYLEGSMIRDYTLFGIQSKQILSASADQKPSHLIVTSAAVAIEVIDQYLQQLSNQPE